MGDSMKNKKKLIAVIVSLISIDSVSAMEVVDCGGLGSVPYVMIRFIGRIVNIIKVIVPVILIIMGMIDMAKATTASDEKQMQTSRKMFIKRIIYAVMVLFVVSIVQLLFTILQTSVFQKENNLLGCVSCVIGNDCDSEEIDLKETTATRTGSKTKKIKVTRVVIMGKKETMKEKETFIMSVKVLPVNATNIGVTYKSSKPSVATVSSFGKITAKKTGTTTITVQSASNKSAKDSFKLTIKDSLDSKRQKVIDYAKKFLGNPYVYGGTSLTHGTDCSGFTMGVYKHFGYNLPRTSGSQSGYGKKVSSLSNAKPGDLLFYSNGTRINHVALYMGNNKVIHASNPKDGIKTTSPANYRTIAKIRRVIY